MNGAAELVALVAERSGRARVRLTGRSMRPLLARGMVVDVEPAGPAPRRGDVLVYRTPRGLVAHRLLGRQADVYFTCGDAHPDRLEAIAPAAVVGRVAAVWASDEPGARRIDGRLFYAAGRFFAATRPLRAACVYAGRRLPGLFAAPAALAGPPAFRALVAATRAFEAGENGRGVAALAAIPLPVLLETVKRHHASGCVAQWLDRAAAAGVAVPAAMAESFLRIRWTNALQADRVLARVREVVRRLAGAGIDAIVLKGGARLAAGEPGADLQFSGDVDVLVPPADADRAVALLRDAGFVDRLSRRRVAFYAAHLHQRAPLFGRDGGVPVEIHVALTIPHSVSQPLTFADLAPFAQTVNGPAGEVRVLDDVAAAVHLAYHGRDFRVWRDVVLLSRKLGALTSQERARFDAFVAGERRDSVRLRAVVAAAERLRTADAPPGAVARRYLGWALEREDMPELFRRRSAILEALFARRTQHFAGVSESARQCKGWLYNVFMLPPLVRYLIWARRTRGAGAVWD